jgi:rubrerythrin
MSLLSTEPPAPVRSLDELFALAEALETEAASRYAQLAQQMRAVGLVDVAEVFEHLAAEERGHGDEVMAWSRADTGHAPDPARIRWQPPTTFDEEEARGIASSVLASAYRALSMAVRNEERAFALWTYIAAQAEDPKIRAAAERMAREELRHAALLRRERRRAFHAERDRHVTGAGRPRPVVEAAQVERSLSALLASLAETHAAAGPHVARLLDLGRDAAAMADEAASAAATEAARGEAPASPAARRGDRASASAADDTVPEGLLGALRLAERAVEDYLAAADAAQDEAAMAQLQSLAERAIARVAALRRMAGQG